MSECCLKQLLTPATFRPGWRIGLRNLWLTPNHFAPYSAHETKTITAHASQRCLMRIRCSNPTACGNDYCVTTRIFGEGAIHLE